MLMTRIARKYISVLFLIALFIFKGLVTVIPFFAGYFFAQARQEMQVNSDAENTQEKSSQKEIEIKEFTGHFYNDYSSSAKYAILSKTTPARQRPIEKDVILPVATPPPELFKL